MPLPWADRGVWMIVVQRRLEDSPSLYQTGAGLLAYATKKEAAKDLAKAERNYPFADLMRFMPVEN